MAIVLRQGGSPSSPVVLSSYGPGHARLHSASSSPAILISDCAGIEILHLILAGPGAATAGSPGLLLTSSGTSTLVHVLVQDVEVTGFTMGISIQATDCGGFAEVVLSHVSAHHNRDNGISSYGPWTSPFRCFAHKNIQLIDCFAFNNSGYG